MQMRNRSLLPPPRTSSAFPFLILALLPALTCLTGTPLAGQETDPRVARVEIRSLFGRLRQASPGAIDTGCVHECWM